MKINKLIGQHMMMGLSGHTLTADERDFIVDNNISGVVLFSRNLSEPEQVRELCLEIHELRNKMESSAPLFVGIDMEGGRVHRLKPPFTQWPALKKLGDIDNATVTFHFAYRMGLELAAAGINLNFAPCLDVFSNPKNTVIGDRSISSNPEIVGKHASALVRGYVKAGIVPCLKHFPGHGNTLIDSHEDLPRETSDRKRLDSLELIPFRKGFRARAEMVMTSHILFEQLDPEWPVTLSSVFLKDMLREEFRYKGLIISDDLDMKALTKNFSKEDIPVRAIAAGVDLLMYCNEPDSPGIAMDALINAVAQGTLSRHELEASHNRILHMKQNFIWDFEVPSFADSAKIIGNSEHARIAKEISEGHAPDGLIERESA